LRGNVWWERGKIEKRNRKEAIARKWAVAKKRLKNAFQKNKVKKI
jgi:hypothetical protein